MISLRFERRLYKVWPIHRFIPSEASIRVHPFIHRLVYVRSTGKDRSIFSVCEKDIIKGCCAWHASFLVSRFLSCIRDLLTTKGAASYGSLTIARRRLISRALSFLLSFFPFYFSPISVASNYGHSIAQQTLLDAPRLPQRDAVAACMQ